MLKADSGVDDASPAVRLRDTSLGWHLKRSCFSLNDGALLNFPMADDEMSGSSMTASALMSRKSLDALTDRRNFVDFDNLVTGRRLADVSTPPYASADALSESELSELEVRVARGDFAVTLRDLATTTSGSSYGGDEPGNVDEDALRTVNGQVLSDEGKIDTKADESEISFINDNVKINEKSVELGEVRPSDKDRDETPNRTNSNQHCVQAHIKGAPANELTDDLINDIYNYYAPYSNQSNKDKNESYVVAVSKLRPLIPSSWLAFDDTAITRSSSMPSLEATVTPAPMPVIPTQRQFDKNATGETPAPEMIPPGDPRLFARAEYLAQVIMPSSTTSAANRFPPAANSPTRQCRMLLLRPDERLHAGESDNYWRRPYQQSVLDQPSVQLPYLQQSIQPQPFGLVPVAELYVEDPQHLPTGKRRLPELPSDDERTHDDDDGDSRDGNSDASDAPIIEPQRLLDLIYADAVGHTFFSTNPYVMSALSPSTNVTPRFDRNEYDALRCRQRFGDEYQLSYGMDESLAAQNAAGRRRPRNYGMDGSYYEDDSFGGRPLVDATTTSAGVPRGDEKFQLYDNQHAIHSGYNLTDGENSSGISSCCTSSSTVTGGVAVPDDGHGLPVAARSAPSDDDDGCRPTHRAQFAFVPRHSDELTLDVGDALHVNRTGDDHWCYGTNLRTGKSGVFPFAHICAIDLVDEICQVALSQAANFSVPQKQERDMFYLTMLASVEVAHHKGNDVLVQAINKVCSMYKQKDEVLVSQTVLMEISYRGVHVIDKRKEDFFRCPTFDFFYSLQNISFCGAHPKHLRYFGFITKHPLLPRFACHVFLSQESTQPIVESIGRAFKRSYDEYMAFAHPTEDIFIE